MYKLMVIDSSNKDILVYESNNLFNIDCFTGEFENKEDLLDKMSIRFNRKIKDVIIKYKYNNKEKYITDIMYMYDCIPDIEFLENKYATFLFEDKTRIKDSCIFYMPNIRNSGIQTISYFDIIGALDKRMDNYRARRNSYFQMINSGYLNIKIKPQQEDFLKSTINSIDTSDGTDIDIMIDKIKSGEIEPNYYDLDDYLSMKRSKRR